MLRRIFVAVPVSERLQKEIENWRIKYGRLPVRWLAGKNLHITLVPPWYETDVQNVVDGLKSAGKGIGHFDISFRKAEFGPDLRRPRLVWAEGEAPKEMVFLKSEVEKALNRKPEKRPFRLHLTIARFRPEMFSSFPIKKLEEYIFWPDKVGSFVLMETHLSREGADYEILGKYELKA